MTAEQIQIMIAECERRFRSRTPMKSMYDGLPAYRVTRSEMTQFANQNGIKLSIGDDDYDRALYQLYDRLRLEFPDEKWDKIGTYSADRTRRKELGLPPTRNSNSKARAKKS